MLEPLVSLGAAPAARGLEPRHPPPHPPPSGLPLAATGSPAAAQCPHTASPAMAQVKDGDMFCFPPRSVVTDPPLVVQVPSASASPSR